MNDKLIANTQLSGLTISNAKSIVDAIMYPDIKTFDQAVP